MKNFDELVNKKMSISELMRTLDKPLPTHTIIADDYKYIKRGMVSVFLSDNKHVDVIYKWINTVNEYKKIHEKEKQGDETWANDAIVVIESVEYYEKGKGIYKRKSKRDANLIVSKNGNGANTAKITIPIPFAKALGFTLDEKAAEIELDTDKIIIRKKKTN